MYWVKKIFQTLPGLPPYYDKNFFRTIKHYQDNSTMNIGCMTIKQWYKTLLNDQILMNEEQDSLPQLIPCRVELLNPGCNWQATWSNVRMKGLTSELMSFLFKLVHQLLPSRNRIARMNVGGTSDNRCLLCNTNSEENFIHAFFMCPNNHIAGLHS